MIQCSTRGFIDPLQHSHGLVSQLGLVGTWASSGFGGEQRFLGCWRLSRWLH